jgi:hypothetical protein
MSRRAQQLGAKFDFKTLVKQYVSLYQLIIQQGSEPTSRRQLRDLLGRIKESVGI